MPIQNLRKSGVQAYFGLKIGYFGQVYPLKTTKMAISKNSILPSVNHQNLINPSTFFRIDVNMDFANNIRSRFLI